MRARITLAAVVLFAAGGLTRAQDRPLERTELDKRVVGAVYETAVKGTEIFNKGDYGGCYRLYEGTLMAVAPLLDHRPKLQGVVKERLKRAGQLKTAADAAFELRKALDEIQDDIAPAKDKKIDDKEKEKDKGKEPKPATMWDRLGGEKGVRKVVDDLVAAAADDPKVDFFRGGKFKPKDDKAVPHLKQMLVEMISENTGGPLKYTGKSMAEAHKGMMISDAEFDALGGHLVAALKKNGAAQADIDAIVKVVETTRKAIVEKK